MLYRYQAYLFFPLVLLEAFNVHVATVRGIAVSTLIITVLPVCLP